MHNDQIAFETKIRLATKAPSTPLAGIKKAPSNSFLPLLYAFVALSPLFIVERLFG